MSGSASSTVRMDDSTPWKSGTSTSTDVCGLRSLIWRIVSANAQAP
jgi:hypothetical protein